MKLVAQPSFNKNTYPFILVDARTFSQQMIQLHYDQQGFINVSVSGTLQGVFGQSVEFWDAEVWELLELIIMKKNEILNLRQPDGC